ncbi:MAG: epoxide hydrolase [Hyphococcus sp.]|nr:MAG: epoxide hydrolase [Marinicaulis sp.]
MQSNIDMQSRNRQIVLMKPDFPKPKIVTANNVEFAVYEADGDPGRQRPPIILIHGWPEIAYSWRNQIYAFAEAGYRTIAIDLKGFGYSSAPEDPAEYSIDILTSDIAALLDALSIEKAIFCGHDWGGSIVWSMGQWRPERTANIISVCTPLKPQPPAAPLAILQKRFTDKHYFVQFQERGTTEKLFASDIERLFKLMFRGPAPREQWASLIPAIYDLPGRFKSGKPVKADDLIVSAEVIETYINAYAHSGFHGGINLYRNIDRNWELMKGRDEIIKMPSLWIGAELDLFLPPETAEGMDKIVQNLDQKIIAGSGHWVTWEKPDVLNKTIVGWLEGQTFN